MIHDPRPFTSEGTDNMEKLLFNFSEVVHQTAISWYINDDELDIRFSPGGININDLLPHENRNILQKIFGGNTLAQIGIGVQMLSSDIRTQNLIPFFTQVDLVAKSLKLSGVGGNQDTNVRNINGVLRIVKGYSHTTAK